MKQANKQKKVFQKKCTAGLEKAGRRFSFFQTPVSFYLLLLMYTRDTRAHTHMHIVSIVMAIFFLKKIA